MNSSRIFKTISILGLATVFTAVLLVVNQNGLAQQNGSTESTAAKQAVAEKLPGLAQLVHKSTRLDENFSDLQRRLPKIYEREKMEERFASLTEKIAKLKEKTLSLQSSDKLNYQDLAALKSAFQQKSGRM